MLLFFWPHQQRFHATKNIVLTISVFNIFSICNIQIKLSSEFNWQKKTIEKIKPCSSPHSRYCFGKKSIFMDEIVQSFAKNMEMLKFNCYAKSIFFPFSFLEAWILTSQMNRIHLHSNELHNVVLS